MFKIVLIAIIGCASAAPGYDYVPLAKSTLTTSSQSIDHGTTHILSPVQHVMAYVPLAKTTSTHSNHVVDHGSTTLVHAPLVHHVEHHPVVFPAVYSYKTPDSAISHHSSEVHETVPYYAYH